MKSHSQSPRQQQRDEMLNKIPIFLSKTYRIVDNPKYSDVIEWTEDGTAFVIKDIGRLTTTVFSEHFKHNNFLSFIRQLNMYGFHKIGTMDDNQGPIFKHQYFQRDDMSLLPLIKRKNNNNQEGQSQQVVAIPSREEKLQKQVSLLRNQHEELQSMMEVLVEQNKTITAQNKAFLSVMSDMRQKYRKKLQTLMLLFLFGKKNKPDEFIFPPQLNHLIETFQQINSNGQIRMLPQKKMKKNHHQNLPMLTQGEHPHFYSDGERSQMASNFDKEESDDIFKVINASKSRDNLSKKKSFLEDKSEKDEEEIWQNGIPVSPLSVRSIPHKMEQADFLDKEKWKKLEQSDSEFMGGSEMKQEAL